MAARMGAKRGHDVREVWPSPIGLHAEQPGVGRKPGEPGGDCADSDESAIQGENEGDGAMSEILSAERALTTAHGGAMRELSLLDKNTRQITGAEYYAIFDAVADAAKEVGRAEVRAELGREIGGLRSNLAGVRQVLERAGIPLYFGENGIHANEPGGCPRDTWDCVLDLVKQRDGAAISLNLDEFEGTSGYDCGPLKNLTTKEQKAAILGQIENFSLGSRWCYEINHLLDEEGIDMDDVDTGYTPTTPERVRVLIAELVTLRRYFNIIESLKKRAGES